MITTAAAAANMNNSQLALTGQAQVANEGEKIYKQWCVSRCGAHTHRRAALTRVFSLPWRARQVRYSRHRQVLPLRCARCFPCVLVLTAPSPSVTDRDSRLTGADAVKFFQRSGLPRETLSRGALCSPCAGIGTCL